MNTENQKLGLIALVAIVVSTMIGSGVDSLPQNMAEDSAVAPVVLAWIISGFGMFFIAQTFFKLSELKPDLQSGIYMYAREGFGELPAFFVAWGYWLMTIFSNVAFSVMVMDTLDYFMPGKFSGGNNINSIIGSSILVWGFHILVDSGTRVAGKLNLLGTIAKIIPLILFVGILMYFLDVSQLTTNIWGQSNTPGNPKLGSVLSQVLSPLYVALWCFIGIEGAVALSGRARNKADVGRATMIGFVVSLLICIAISVLPFGILSQHALSLIPNPSTAGVIKTITGEWGEVVINLGVLISILSSWLAWTMICAEIPMVAAQNGTFPKWFAKNNQKGAASSALLASSVLMQLVVVLVYFAHDAWLTLLGISAIMVLPAYFFSAAYLAKLSFLNKDGHQNKKRIRDALIIAFIGMFFCLFMLYASAFAYVLMTPLLLTLGLPLYLIRKLQDDKHKSIFTRHELLGIALLLVIDLIIVICYFKGMIQFQPS
jgi:arginine:ornithine antiporter/lysine permease